MGHDAEYYCVLREKGDDAEYEGFSSKDLIKNKELIGLKVHHLMLTMNLALSLSSD